MNFEGEFLRCHNLHVKCAATFFKLFSAVRKCCRWHSGNSPSHIEYINFSWPHEVVQSSLMVFHCSRDLENVAMTSSTVGCTGKFRGVSRTPFTEGIKNNHTLKIIATAVCKSLLLVLLLLLQANTCILLTCLMDPAIRHGSHYREMSSQFAC